MASTWRMWYVGFVLVGIGGWEQAAAGVLLSAHPSVLSHEIEATINPATHELAAHDHMVVILPSQAETVSFGLAPTLHVESILLGDGDGTRNDQHRKPTLSFSIERPGHRRGQRVIVSLPPGHGERVTLSWIYRGIINDPPKEPRHLRFVTPSDTAGHIGQEGVYLSGESLWYPDIDGSYSTYRLHVQVPEGWTVVTQGLRQQNSSEGGWVSSTWVVAEPSEALTVVANRFVVKSRDWTSRTGQRIELATYFFPDNADLADEYLDATATYLDAYIQILGDYPFHRFAVVENFFPSGLGMPSFTLLGSGSIKRHYVQPYALGHEIVHSWIGNAVFNRQGAGNWVEGLTTYLANYYWYELTGNEQQATEQRRLMAEGYSLYVEPEQDYPVARFFAKEDEKDNAIGYHKAAFLFHHLRHELGNETFWRGIKTFVQRHRYQPADWSDIEAVFAQESGRDLRWFFEQWVERGGAPQVSLDDLRAYQLSAIEGQERWRLLIRMGQRGRPFQLTIPLNLVFEQGTEIRWFRLGSAAMTMEEVSVSARPLAVQMDPQWMVFRRIPRSQLTPMLNGYVTDKRRTVVLLSSEGGKPFQPILDRIVERESHWPLPNKTVVISGDETVPVAGSVLILATRDQTRSLERLIKESCGDLIQFSDGGVEIKGRRYEGSEWAMLFSCRRPTMPGSVVTVLYGMSREAVERIGPYLFYYGWHSYMVFKNGTVVERGLWQDGAETKEVEIDGGR